MGKDKIDIETAPIKLNLPCIAKKGCKGRLEQTPVGKIIRTKTGKYDKTAKIEIATRIMRCPVCYKLNPIRAFEISFNE